MEEQKLWPVMLEFIERQNAKTTRRTYRQQAINFIGWVHEFECLSSREVFASDFTTQNILNFRDAELRRVSASTVRLSVAFLKSFDKWFSLRTGKRRVAEVVKAPTPRKSKMTGHKNSTREYIQEFIHFPHSTFQGARFAALLLLYNPLSLRAEEALNINLSQINFESRIIESVLVKGGKYLDKPLITKDIKVLDNYLYLRSRALRESFEKFGEATATLTPKQAGSYPLIISTHGARPGRPLTYRLSASTVRRWLRELGAELGDRIHPHSHRHDYLRRLCDECKDIRLVAQHAGHSSTQITMLYTERTDDHIREAREAA